MAFDINSLRTDKSLETEGTWISFGNGAEIKIARLGNEKHLRYLEKLREPYLDASGNVDADKDTLHDISNKAMAKYIIMDWKGFEEKDKEVPYSESTAYKYLSEVDDFFTMIVSLATDRENFQKKKKEIAEKNL